MGETKLFFSVSERKDALASACVPHSEKSFPPKLSNETTFKIDGILICPHLLVNQKALC